MNLKKIGKVFTATFGLAAATIAPMSMAAPTANAATSVCPATSHLGVYNGIDYSSLNESIVCTYDASFGGTINGLTDPFSNTITITYGPNATTAAMNALVDHESMHMVHFFSTGTNEWALNQSMGFTTMADWRTESVDTAGTAAWKASRLEGIAEGWPTCRGEQHHTDMKYTPKNCTQFTNAVYTTLKQAKYGTVVPYVGFTSINRNTPTSTTLWSLENPYLNQPVGTWYYEYHLQGNGIDQVVGHTTVTMTTANQAKGELKPNITVPSTVPGSKMYKVVVYRFSTDANGNKANLIQGYAAGQTATVLVN